MADLHLRFKLRVEDGDYEIQTCIQPQKKPNGFRSCFWRTSVVSCCIQPNGDVSFISRLVAQDLDNDSIHVSYPASSVEGILRESMF